MASPGKGSHASAIVGITEIQTKQYASTSSSTTHTITFNSTPTSGNRLILTVVADNTVTTPAGWTQHVANVDFVGQYIYSKISNGTETSVTVTIGGSTSCAICAFEYANLATGIDKTAVQTNQGSSPASIWCGDTAAITASDELYVTCAGVPNADVALSITAWSNSLVQLGTKSQTSGSASNCWNTSARLVVTGASGAAASTATLSAAGGGRANGAIATFKN
jgi:hypothetical protein